MDIVIWDGAAVGNACVLDSIENVERARTLHRGLSFLPGFPADAQFRMSKEHKKNTALTDDVSNTDDVKVCSPRLVAFLQKQKLAHVEYLPVRILDHKGRVASADYRMSIPAPPRTSSTLRRAAPATVRCARRPSSS